MKLSITIDSEKCEGHGLCYAYCPEVFLADDEGYAYLADGTVEADAELAEKIRDAEASCPELAIAVEDA